jgi:hypothetical protein
VGDITGRGRLTVSGAGAAHVLAAAVNTIGKTMSRRSGTGHSRHIPVVFITGAGRSGTTLLERVISTHDGFWSVGELHHIWERSFRENQLCGCGVPFHECPFWGEVSLAAFGVEPAEFDEAAVLRHKRSLQRKGHLPTLMLHPERLGPSVLDYARYLDRLYTMIFRVSGAQAIVDSSKEPRHGLILSALPGVRVHAVHLVRDPRAVAFSWRRERRRPEIYWSSENMDVYRLSKAAMEWLAYNSLAEALKAHASSYCRVRYEDFVGDPTGVLARIMSSCSFFDRTSKQIDDHTVTLQPSHTAAGNPMRFRSGKVALELDDEWRRAMPMRDRAEVTALTWPLLLRYGYRLRPRDS